MLPARVDAAALDLYYEVTTRESTLADMYAPFEEARQAVFDAVPLRAEYTMRRGRTSVPRQFCGRPRRVADGYRQSSRAAVPLAMLAVVPRPVRPLPASQGVVESPAAASGQTDELGERESLVVKIDEASVLGLVELRVRCHAVLVDGQRRCSRVWYASPGSGSPVSQREERGPNWKTTSVT